MSNPEIKAVEKLLQPTDTKRPRYLAVIQGAAYMRPERPGFSIEMKPASIAENVFAG